MKQGVQHLHFLGICGTAMGSVAAALRDRGYTISGSDENVYPPMSTFLREKGVTITEGYRPENIPAEAEVIVVGNAIRRGNPEVEAVLNRRLYYLSLPETLKEFFLRDTHNLVVTGTHGKTTTTSLLTWILEQAGEEPSYMIGGLAHNLKQGACFRDTKYFVIEGDEYDTAFFDKRSKFVHYLPELVIVNNVEFDHADIFENLDAIKLSFQRMLNIVPANGMVLLNADDPVCVELGRKCPAPIVEVGFSENAGHCIRAVKYGPEGASFELFNTVFETSMVGEYNVRNAAMAASAARFYGIPLEKIQAGLASFAGIKRRQEVRGVVRGIRVIDDFGHHPTAIRNALQGLRQQYPEGKLWAVFEPRSNTTRRAVFQDVLASAFDEADGVVLAEVARLDQMPENDRLNPEKVIAAIVASGKPAFYEPHVDSIIGRLREMAREGDTIVIFSNGGFGDIHERLLREL